MDQVIKHRSGCSSAIYNETMDHVETRQQIPHEFLQDLNQSFELYIEQGFTAEWTEILPLLYSAHHDVVSFYDYRNAKILKSIAGIYFFNLNQLYLENNYINSIEALGFVDMPKLRIIYLAYNHVTNFAPLIKSHLPNIQFLTLHSNKANSFDFFHRTLLVTQFQNLLLSNRFQSDFQQFTNADYYQMNRIKGSSLNGTFLAKINPRKIHKLIIKSPWFLKSKIIMQKFENYLGKVPQGEQQMFQAM